MCSKGRHPSQHGLTALLSTELIPMKTAIQSILIASLSSGLLIGCTPMDDDQYDPALLQQYRAALPSMDRLAATAPEASVQTLVGDPALYPTTSWEIVIGINGSVAGIIGLMQTIVALPPTVFNSQTSEFLWGPWPSDDGVGYVAAYIREADAGADFRYEYALLRGAGNDLATMTPVIWGGATPDEANADYGLGVTVWDFENNYEFEIANNPNAANEDFNRGRFATLYGKGADQTMPANELGFVVAVFRDFIPQDKPGAAAADLDYFYGRYVAADVTVDFIDWEAGIDISDPPDAVLEDVGVRMAFLNEGMGRAEADAAGGSLEAGVTASGTECWGNGLERTYLNFTVDGGAQQGTYTEGTVEGCALFQPTLDELNIPSLQDIDPSLLSALDQVASTGIPAP
jgi:hypothetical protein